MRAFFFFISSLIVCNATFAQPEEGKTFYHDRYAHPQKSNVSFQLKSGLTAMNTPAPLQDDIWEQNLFLKPQFTLGLGYHFTNYIGFVLRTTYYRHSYNAPDRLEDFEGVKSNNFAATLNIKHYLFSVKSFDEYLRKFNYYAQAGAGTLYHNPKAKPSGERLSDSLGFNNFALVVPIGLGVEYRLSNFFVMALEVDLNLTHTEYLDGVPAKASGRRYDHFGTMGVNLSYRIPRKDYHYNNFLKLKNKDY